LRAWHVGASGRSPIMGVRQDAPTIETIISKISYEIIKHFSLSFAIRTITPEPKFEETPDRRGESGGKAKETIDFKAIVE
jgi:hypothetical protein